MKKALIVISILLAAVSPLFALDAEDVTAENIASILKNAGLDAEVDEEGDVAITDQYDYLYWIIAYPEEKRLWIESGWPAYGDVSTSDAARIVNDANSNLIMLRAWYEPVPGTFYADYDFFYSDILDEDLLVEVVEFFLTQADVYTDYLISEEVI